MTRLLIPFAAACLLIGFGAGNGAFLAALAGQGLLTWIVALLFFHGFFRLKKYDEEIAEKHWRAEDCG